MVQPIMGRQGDTVEAASIFCKWYLSTFSYVESMYPIGSELLLWQGHLEEKRPRPIGWFLGTLLMLERELDKLEKHRAKRNTLCKGVFGVRVIFIEHGEQRQVLKLADCSCKDCRADYEQRIIAHIDSEPKAFAYDFYDVRVVFLIVLGLPRFESKMMDFDTIFTGELDQLLASLS